MKLFIDSANSYFIIALIKNKKVVNFMIKKSDRDMVKNANYWLALFCKKNKVNLKMINAFYFTIGPGSFTAAKVAINIIKTFNLVNPVKEFGYISSFDLLCKKNTKYVVLPFGKSKQMIKKYRKFLWNKVKVTSLDYKFKNKYRNRIINSYDNFKAEQIEQKFIDKKFKVVENIDNLKLIYLNLRVKGNGNRNKRYIKTKNR